MFDSFQQGESNHPLFQSPSWLLPMLASISYRRRPLAVPDIRPGPREAGTCGVDPYLTPAGAPKCHT